jgi:hypothetical protein
VGGVELHAVSICWRYVFYRRRFLLLVSVFESDLLAHG